jgi:hypothetical protein
MVKLRTGSAAAVCMKAATLLESTPPDRNTPTGTSLTICRATTSRSCASSASTASPSLRRLGGASRATSRGSQ